MVREFKKCILNNAHGAEKSFLNEVLEIICSVDISDLVNEPIYDSYDLACDIFDLFLSRYNIEIDNSYKYGYSEDWLSLIKSLRDFLLDHITTSHFDKDDIDLINALEKTKYRLIFAMHRSIFFRGISYFWEYISGRTSTQIKIDQLIYDIKSGQSKDIKKPTRVRAAISVIKSARLQKHRFLREFHADNFCKLIASIYSDNIESVTKLLAVLPDLHQVDQQGWTLFHHWAASSKVSMEIFNVIIKLDLTLLNGVIERTGWNGVFIIINNCTANDEVKLQKLNLLLDHKVDVCSKDKLYGKLPIHYAIETNSNKLVSALYHDNQESIQVKDNYEETPGL